MTDLKARFKQLGKDSLIYGLGGALGRGIGLFTLPIFTRIFSPAEYGTIEMLTVLSSLLGVIMVMGMDSAQTFYFFEQKSNGKESQARVVTAILQWEIMWGGAMVLLLLICAGPINRFFFGGQLSWKYFAIVFFGAFWIQILNQSIEIFRLLYRPFSFISITLAQSLLSVGLSLLLTLVFGWGILGFICGTLTGAMVAGCFSWWRNREYLDFSGWHRDWWPRLLKFGAPLAPTGLIMFVLSSSDRWFINHFCGQEALGLFAVGAKFGMLIYMVIIAFRQAWWPLAVDAMHSDDGPALYRTMARLYLGLSCAGVVLITAMSPYLLQWFAARAYAPAYPIVGILSWSSVFYGFCLISTIGILKAEKTVWSTIPMGVAALINIGLNFLLVPRYGALGAATATSVSFGIWNILTLWVSERLWRVGYDYLVMGTQLGLGVLTCIIILLLYRHEANPWSIWFLVMPVVLFLLGLSVNREQLRKIGSLALVKIKSA